ncbi:hypothetical protein K2173_028329 [Erythroxylum novogranatense]|uniref:Uncharacterized protein n=1 Tax=Erythroxylum novogranatense TaxID=1862640 RepID=A0AAV8U1H4_9ROSI|nr:hypothetical protein K2173_028329 [Erythroxylum novogranatense]
MPSKYRYLVTIQDVKSTPTNSSTIPMCTIEFHIRFRYQLKFPSNEGQEVVLDDVVTPEQRVTSRLPLVFPLTLWRELYLSDLLKNSNLGSRVRACLNPKIADTVSSFAARNGNKGFDMVLNVGIFKVETMGKDEVDRIARGLVGVPSNSLRLC